MGNTAGTAVCHISLGHSLPTAFDTSHTVRAHLYLAPLAALPPTARFVFVVSCSFIGCSEQGGCQIEICVGVESKLKGIRND